MPDDDALHLAVSVLAEHAGEFDSPRVRAVIAWIEAEQTDRAVKQAARKAGIPIAKVRARLRAMESQ